MIVDWRHGIASGNGLQFGGHTSELQEASPVIALFHGNKILCTKNLEE